MWLLYLALSTFVLFSNAYIYSHTNTANNAVDPNQNQEATIISDVPENCIYVTFETGHFTYKSKTSKNTVCGIYLLADPDYLIQVTFTDFDVPCEGSKDTGSLVQYLDGWELNGEVFPTVNGVSETNAVETEFCSKNKPGNRTFVSSQNGALISYRILDEEKGFTIHVEHKKHPSPCNVIHGIESVLILKNHGKGINCSIWNPAPTKVKLNSYSVGNHQSAENSSNKCSHSSDRIEIGGSGGLDTSRIEILDTICNKSNSNGEKEELINCSTTTVKLISTGNYENYVNVSFISDTTSKSANTNTKYQCSSSSKPTNQCKK